MNIEIARQNMIKHQIRCNQILEDSILDVFYNTPRENFVPDDYKECAFADMHIPLAHQQVMMRPNEEAHMLQSLNLKNTDQVLEIGTGTGFTAALLAKLAKYVESVDIFPEFTSYAQEKLQQHFINNVELITQDATTNWPKKKYDAIFVSAALERCPRYILESLTIDGRLFIILGTGYAMHATLITRTEKNNWVQKSLFETKLPMLVHAKKTAFVF